MRTYVYIRDLLPGDVARGVTTWQGDDLPAQFLIVKVQPIGPLGSSHNRVQLTYLIPSRRSSQVFSYSFDGLRPVELTYGTSDLEGVPL